MRLYCKYALPEAEVKAEAWNIITGNNSTLSKKMIEEVINAFNQPNQLDLTDPYLQDKYFTGLYQFYEGNVRKHFQKYFFKLMPRFGEVNQATMDKLKNVKDSVMKEHATSNQFLKDIQEGIETL